MNKPKRIGKIKALTGAVLSAFFVMSMSLVKDHSASTMSFKENNPERSNQAKKRIAIDVGLVVSDMDKSLAFYRDMLDLEQIAEIRTKLIGDGRMVQLKHGASLVKLLKMVETSTAQKKGFVDVQGYRYMTLMVENIDSISEKIEKNNVEIVLPLTKLGNGANILMVKDPDGNVVEFVQEAN